jgi:protein SCO1/2
VSDHLSAKQPGLSRLAVPSLALVALLAGLWFGGIFSTPQDAQDQAAEQIITDDASIPGGFAYPQPKTINDFQLTDHNGDVFDVQRLKGSWTFVYLGYTFCPDVCPITLAELNQVQQRLDEANNDQDVQYVFVSVDPQRDTLERLKEYTEYFNPRFIGATSGDEDQLQILARNLAMVFVPVSGEQNDPNYLVDHSSSVALVGPDGKLHALFTAPQKAAELADGLSNLRARWQATSSS